MTCITTATTDRVAPKNTIKGNMKNNPGHCYKVDATRIVGHDSYYSDSMKKEFSFGKGKEFPTGVAAKAAAEAFAQSIMSESSILCIWKMNGHGGKAETLKEDREQRFHTEWPKK